MDTPTTLLYHKFVTEQSRINGWVFRTFFELMEHDYNCVVTLTFDEAHLADDGQLHVRDFQLFMKRLRKSLEPKKVRYLGCGEYGSKGLRPHYHVILFGYCPDDLVYQSRTDKGVKAYRSAKLEKLWGNGFISVSLDIDPPMIPYMLKYMQKFNVLPKGFKKPFMLCSRRPGIGAEPHGLVDFANDKMYAFGRVSRVSRFFLRRAPLDVSQAVHDLRNDYYRRVFSAVQSDCELDYSLLSTSLVESDRLCFEKKLKSFQKWLDKKVVK